MRRRRWWAPWTRHPETLDDIDAAVDAIPDEEITRRLHEVLARARTEGWTR